MCEYKQVLTGEVDIGKSGDVLDSSALGSCIVICVYSFNKKVGGMAHVMLPGYAPESENEKKTKYAGNAIEELLSKMTSCEVDINNSEICLVGGANVLKESDSMIAKNNLDSIIEILREKSVKVSAQAVGGTTRRTATLNIEHGSVFFYRRK